MAPGRYEMSVSVHDKRRNEDSIGSVTVIVYEVVKEAFVKQVFHIYILHSIQGHYLGLLLSHDHNIFFALHQSRKGSLKTT